MLNDHLIFIQQSMISFYLYGYRAARISLNTKMHEVSPESFQLKPSQF